MSARGSRSSVESDESDESSGVEVPWQRLDPQTLRRVIEEFVTREGTDYGGEVSLDDKVRQVLAQLQVGTAAVVFDPSTESVSLVSRTR